MVIKAGPLNKNLVAIARWVPVCDEKTIYTIRALVSRPERKGERLAYFEEGVVGYTEYGIEIGMGEKRLREVQPPMSSEEVEELAFSHEMVLVK